MHITKRFLPYAADGIVKIKIVIPACTSAFNDMILSAARSVASPQTHLDIENIEEGNPCIESKYHSALNAPAVVRLIEKSEREGFDAVYVCDMDMCGVDAGRCRVSIPVQGGFSCSIPQAVSFGRFSIVSIIEDVGEMQREFAARFGGLENLASIRHTALRVHELTETERVFDDVYAAAKQAIELDRARAIVFGCSGFADMAERVTRRLAAECDGLYVPVIDPNRTAILTLEMQVKLGLCHKHRR